MQKLPYSNKRGISNEENLLRNTKEYISYEERQLFITLSQLAWNEANAQNYHELFILLIYLDTQEKF